MRALTSATLCHDLAVTVSQRRGAVWVCNHTSMIDYIILTAYSPFAVIMQLHPGWVRPPHCIFFTSRAASLKSAHHTESLRIVQSYMYRALGHRLVFYALYLMCSLTVFLHRRLSASVHAERVSSGGPDSEDQPVFVACRWASCRRRCWAAWAASGSTGTRCACLLPHARRSGSAQFAFAIGPQLRH